MIFWAGLEHERTVTKLPEEATIVKLIRPKPMMPASNVVPKPQTEFKVPQTVPPLESPKPNKSKQPKKEEPKQPRENAVKSNQQVPKEYVGQAGTMRLQNPGQGFEYDFYLAIVQSKIEQNFRPPPGYRGEQMATVAFTIQSSGAITDINLIKPSGNSLIDLCAERAVKAAGRFPPLPAQYDKGYLGINFEFVVNPKKSG
jgi:periplasmic protein TonB